MKKDFEVWVYESAKEITPLGVGINLSPHAVRVDAGQPAELHMYEKGKHGFGMKKQNLPVDSWIERFEDWLATHGF